MRALVPRLFHYVHFIRRSHTLGVRAVVRDGQGCVFLVKHTYVPGWYLPGGGVEWGETLGDALAKELVEEGNIRLTGPARLVAIYQNKGASKRDHVALYDCLLWEQSAPPKVPNREILEVGFFPMDDLPPGVTEATKRRLAELETNGPYCAFW